MFGIRTKLKRKSRLKWAKSIRKTRDLILKASTEESCVGIIRDYLFYINNTISYGGSFGNCYAHITTEHRRISSWSNSTIHALKKVGIKLYILRRDYFLSKTLK